MKEKIIGFFDDVVKEMKKVTWPTKDELKESTKIVIVACLILSAFTYLIDMAITQVFKGIFQVQAIMEDKWYVVRTFSGHESKVKTMLDAEMSEN